jgi:hypothetical protein
MGEAHMYGAELGNQSLEKGRITFGKGQCRRRTLSRTSKIYNRATLSVDRHVVRKTPETSLYTLSVVPFQKFGVR